MVVDPRCEGLGVRKFDFYNDQFLLKICFNTIQRHFNVVWHTR